MQPPQPRKVTLGRTVQAIFLDWLGGRLLDWFPGWFVRRFVRLDSVARQVRLLPHSKRSINWGLNEQAPSVHVWLQVVNHSSVDLVLDRVVLSVWAGQPVAYGVLANRTPITKHSTMDRIPPFHAVLTAAAVDQVKRHQQQSPSATGYEISGTAFFDSKLGSFEVQLVGHDGYVEV